MFIQNNVNRHVIIGEAALSLALGERQISLDSLICTLGRMAKTEESSDRLAQIDEATNWLESFESPDAALQKIPYLQTHESLNEERH